MELFSAERGLRSGLLSPRKADTSSFSAFMVGGDPRCHVSHEEHVYVNHCRVGIRHVCSVPCLPGSLQAEGILEPESTGAHWPGQTRHHGGIASWDFSCGQNYHCGELQKKNLLHHGVTMRFAVVVV